MKLITFLGTGNYQPTTYVFGAQDCMTRFFPVAAAQFTQPTQTLVCVTPTVEKHANWAELSQQLAERGVTHQAVLIPEGHSEANLWEIFDRLTEAVDEAEEVTFDVTHSFRSLPILSLLAMAYLKAAKQVKVKRVLYGAWEAHDEQNRSPVFDLTPFVALLDWLTATTRFIETGDGHALAELLRAGMPAGTEMRDDLAARALGRSLKSGAEAIDTVSLALRLTRPIESMQAAAELVATFEQAMPNILLRAKPFGVLAEQVTQAYGQFALDNPGEVVALAAGLRRQLQMIDWYIRRRHVIQAATLAREWVVSVLALKFEQPMFDHERGRSVIEAALNNSVERRKATPRLNEPGACDAALEALPEVEAIVRVWGQLIELRNDLAHVGMNLAPKPAVNLKRKVDVLHERLKELALTLLPDAAT